MKTRETIHYLKLTALLAFTALMAGCWGGGGGGGSASTPPPVSTVVTGTASKGIIYPGTVVCYGVDATTGTKGSTPLKTVSTKPDGTYSADLGVYSGALIIEVSGTYTDEATNKQVTIDPATPLHTAVDVVDGATNNNRPVAVTALTELAYKQLGNDFSAAKITAANKLVSEIFKVSDIIAVQPVSPTTAVMGGASTEQQAYTLALATLSRMAEISTADGLATFAEIMTILDSFKNDITGSGNSTLGTANMQAFSAALTAATSPASELSGFGTAVANLSAVGTKTLKLTVSVGNVPTGIQLGTVKVTFALPTGVSIRTDESGKALDSMIAATGTIAPGTTVMAGNYQPSGNALIISLVNTTGFRDGDCMTVTLDVTPGTTITASDIQATLNEAKDAGDTYGPVAGVTVALR